MKLLYTVINWTVIQTLALQTLAYSKLFRRELVEYYGHELLIIDSEFCEKAKALSEQILQNTTVQKADTPKLKQFKHNVTNFLHFYAAYKRYRLFNELVLLFKDKVPPNENDKDIQNIWQLLRSLGYDDMNSNYEIQYMKFVKQKFLLKFGRLKLRLTPQELQQQKLLLQWYEGLKKCPNYKCYRAYFTSLVAQHTTAKSNLLQYITAQLDRLNIIYGEKAYEMAKNILKNHKFTQLTATLRQQLIIDLNNFIRKYESHDTINELYNLTRSFYMQILLQYYHNVKAQDHKLIVEIFDEQGCAKFVSDYDKKCLNFIKHGLSRKFKQFKAALNPNELTREKSLIQWYNKLKVLNITMDMQIMFDKFHAMFYEKLWSFKIHK